MKIVQARVTGTGQAASQSMGCVLCAARITPKIVARQLRIQIIDSKLAAPDSAVDLK